MLCESRKITLKNNAEAVLRNPIPSDAKAMSAFLKTCAGETHFILRTPEECNETEEQEKAYLQNVNASPYVLMLVCTVDGEIAGTCSLMFNNHKKTKHRASAAIGILKKYWGLGIGTAMFREMIVIAKEKGLLQLELDYIEGNERARALYQKMGFVETGILPNAVQLENGTLLNEISMIKKL